jgi:hypothetical protein
MGVLSVLRWNNVQTVGALNESALYVARAEDPAAAREQCVAILDRILYGLMAGSCDGPAMSFPRRGRRH